MPHNWLYHFVKNTWLGMYTWFSSYKPKCCPPIRLQDFFNFSFSKTMVEWGGMLIFLCSYISMKTLVKSFNICYVWSAMLNLSILNLLQNNKVPISLGRVELFCLFVACSYTSKEDTMVSCHFVWVWSCMPKILWNNKSPISQERVKWFCQLFACSYFHLVIYPLKLQKYAIFGTLSQPDCEVF